MVQLPAAVQRTPAAEFTFCSDASGSWGCGAWSGQQWFQIPWDDVLAGWHIAAKELLPIVIAAALWGKEWRGKQVHGGCDNQAVVEALEARACRDRVLMDLLRCLFFFEATHDFQLVVSHVRGVDNGIADDLSRNHMSFFQRVPQANPIPSPIPPKLLELLVSQAAKRTSPNWMRQFSSIAGKAHTHTQTHTHTHTRTHLMQSRKSSVSFTSDAEVRTVLQILRGQ